MTENTDKIVSALKGIIDKNGLDYPNREPYKVYKSLIDSKSASKKTAGRILYALINDVQSLIEPDIDPVQLSKKIQTKCSLNKNASGYLSEIFTRLYSKENAEEWQDKDFEGLKQFMEEE